MHRRIKQARTKLGVKQKDVAERLGITQSHLSGVENGSTPTSNLLINAFCSIYNVKNEWLRTGKGEMFEKVECPYQNMLNRMVKK